MAGILVKIETFKGTGSNILTLFGKNMVYHQRSTCEILLTELCLKFVPTATTSQHLPAASSQRLQITHDAGAIFV